MSNKSVNEYYKNKKQKLEEEEDDYPPCMHVNSTTPGEGRFMVPVGQVGEYILYLAFRNQQECEASGLAKGLRIEE